MKFQTQKSFTVIELLVAIALVVLLASIVLVSVNLPERRRQARLVKTLQFSQLAQNALGADAVGIWSFETVDGGATPDRSGYGNHGTVYGAVQAQGLRVPGGGTGMALSFDGSDYVSCGNNFILQPASALTVEAWVRPTAVGSAYYGILGTVDSGGQNGYLMWITTGTGKFRFYIDEDGAADWKYAESDDAAIVDIWYHLVGIWDGATVKLFVNSELQATTGSANNITYNSSFTEIGQYSIYNFNGSIDEVRIYTEALSTFQIQKHYVEGLERHEILAIR